MVKTKKDSRKKNKVDDLYWYCETCGHHEQAQTEYTIGDSEPCIYCNDGTAIVVESGKVEKRAEELYCRGLMAGICRNSIRKPKHAKREDT